MIVIVVDVSMTTDPTGSALCERVRGELQTGTAEMAVLDVAALGEPDAGTIDALARALLTARRIGRSARLRHASPALRGLLALAGLGDVVPCGGGSGVELSGQIEEWEQSGGVEEGVEPGDLPV